jgi:predicted membrane chloride channel (bestrophin family)
MKNYRVLVKSVIIAMILIAIKLVIDYFKLDLIEPHSVLTSLVAGVMFTMAILFSGVLSDYKESEKIPGELVAAFRNLYKDIRVATVTHPDLTKDMLEHIRQLLHILNTHFKTNHWSARDINTEIDKIDEDVEHLAKDGIAPAFIVKIRTEMSNIEKHSYRIDTIMETSFLPAAYAMSVIAAIAVVGTLLFTKMDPYYAAMALFGTVTFVLVSLLLLIKDMDNPFEYGRKSSADVDLSRLFKLEKQLEEQSLDK